MGEHQQRPCTSQQPLLEIENLHIVAEEQGRRYAAVRGVSLQVHRGEVLCLLGETSSGKSAIAQAILRMFPSRERIVQGTIRFHRKKGDGDSEIIDLAKLSERSRELHEIRGQEIALLIRESPASLSPTHSIANQILEVLRLPRRTDKRVARQRVMDLLAQVGVSEPERYLDARPANLSPSLRQRVLMAIAIAAHPHLLVADEPTRGMDVILEAQVLALLEKLQQELGMAMLLTTDDPSVAAALADRVAVMYLGRIVEMAAKKELLVDPMHPYTRGLLQVAVELGREVAPHTSLLTGTTPAASSAIPGCAFHPRCPSYMARKCDAATPSLIEASHGHWVACYLYGSEQEAVA